MPDKPLKSLWGSQGLESSSWTQPLERHVGETWKGQSSGQRTVFLHAHTPSPGRTALWICLYALAWSMPSTLSPRMSCRGRQLALPLRDRRELKGASWIHDLHASSHRLGYYIIHFCQDLLSRKIEFWSSQIWEKRIILSMQCWIQKLSVHTYDAVCGSLWATCQSTRDILHYETAGISWWQTQRIWWKLDMYNIQECLVKPSSFSVNYQLPSSKSWCLLECIHCRRKRIFKVVRSLLLAIIIYKIVRSLLVASTMEKYIG